MSAHRHISTSLSPPLGAGSWTNVPLKVLIIEDERDIAANIWDFLERRGCVVDHAADGAHGLIRAMEGG